MVNNSSELSRGNTGNGPADESRATVTYLATDPDHLEVHRAEQEMAPAELGGAVVMVCETLGDLNNNFAPYLLSKALTEKGWLPYNKAGSSDTTWIRETAIGAHFCTLEEGDEVKVLKQFADDDDASAYQQMATAEHALSEEDGARIVVIGYNGPGATADLSEYWRTHYKRQANLKK